MVGSKAVYRGNFGKINMTDCNKCVTPLDPNQKLSKELEQDEEMRNIPYQEAVGSILFTAQVTRPDLAFPVSC